MKLSFLTCGRICPFLCLTIRIAAVVDQPCYITLVPGINDHIWRNLHVVDMRSLLCCCLPPLQPLFIDHFTFKAAAVSMLAQYRGDATDCSLPGVESKGICSKSCMYTSRGVDTRHHTCTSLQRCLFVALLGSHVPTYELNNETGVLDGLSGFNAPTSVLGEENLHNC